MKLEFWPLMASWIGFSTVRLKVNGNNIFWSNFLTFNYLCCGKGSVQDAQTDSWCYSRASAVEERRAARTADTRLRRAETLWLCVPVQVMQVVREQITRTLSSKPTSLELFKNKVNALNYSEILKLRQTERLHQEETLAPPVLWVTHATSITPSRFTSIIGVKFWPAGVIQHVHCAALLGILARQSGLDIIEGH